MPVDSDEQPWNAPKPAPLIEVAAKPSVPELSLLLDQDRNKSLLLKSPTVQPPEGNLESNFQRRREDEILRTNQYESYNTWKAKNAQALHTITGSSGRQEFSPKTVSSKKVNSSKKKQTGDNEYYYSYDADVYRPPPVALGQVSNKTYRSGENKSDIRFQRMEKENVPQRSVPSVHQQDITFPRKSSHNRSPQCKENYSQVEDSILYPRRREKYQFSNEYTGQIKHIPVDDTRFSVKDTHARKGHHASYGYQGRINQVKRVVQEQVESCYTSDSDTVQSPNPYREEKSKVYVANGMKYVGRGTVYPKEVRGRAPQMITSQVMTPMDTAQLNSHVIFDNLYHIIHLHNERILQLEQQIQQLLQIPADCDKCSPKQNCGCHNCFCKESKNRAFRNDNSEKSERIQTGVERNCAQNTSLLPTPDGNVKPKRSIGVMTSAMEFDFAPNHSSPRDTGHAITQTVNSKVIKAKKQEKVQPSNKAQPTNLHNYYSSQQKLRGEEKQKKQHRSPSKKKTKNVEAKAHSQVDQSFSLNEAELVIRTEAELDDVSPNNTVHVDLQDWCSSSDERYTTDHSSDGGTSEESGSEEDSSDSSTSSSEEDTGEQAGVEGEWTFYNRLNEQVHNILEKTSTSPKQSRSHRSKRTPPSRINDGNADFETENNWSKRVTFDGSPVEDSDILPSMMQVPRVGQTRPTQNSRANGGPDRMEDLVMYSINNGSTNLSFATLRCLERFDMLPAYPGLKMQEHMLQGYQNSSKQKKKKKKSKHSERYPQTPQLSSKRKTKVPSSKILDSTLKHPPKLF